ncbi:hypothetical protein CDD82_2183 [Ophiocordyceps australis]|uniref:Uncharacterized protein n=1 Tax=Ophiocordyceps australis TaxID=1399860 RepID=A0A2C5Y2L3_9HYPO|nr:hypothetical protein CDD82_2183 [Ophiocordyceps australis]
MDSAYSAQASFKFWGVGGELSANVKKSMEELDKHAEIDISIHYQGSIDSPIVNYSPDRIDMSPTEEALAQAKYLSDRFIQNACNHNSRYQYEVIENFPRRQKIIDYEMANQVAYLVLKERVKVAEMTKVLQEAKHVDEELKLQIKFTEVGINNACKKWFEHVATRPEEAVDSSSVLMKMFKSEFYDKYRMYLEVSVYVCEQPDAVG